MWQIINAFLGNIFLMIGAMIFGTIIFNESLIKISKKRIIIDIIVISILHTFILIILNGTLKTILMTILNIAFFADIFRKTKSESIFITILYMTLLIIPDLIQLFFMTEILNLNKDFCYTFAGSLLSNIIISILMVLISFLIKKQLRKIVNIKIEKNIIVNMYSISIFICVGMLFYTTINEFELNDNIMLYLISIITLVVVLFSLIKQMLDNNKLTTQYDELMKNMTTYEIDIENERILRHEAKNELRTIRAMVLEKQPAIEIVEYIDEIVKDKYEVKKEKYAKFGYLPPNGIKGLFYFKTQEAENKGINISINISKKIINSTLYSLSIKQQRDFGRILGVFLDNAIEASLESSVKQLGIEAYVNEENEFKLIISNTYNNVIDKKRVGLERFSTKGNNRGRGLLLVKILVDKNEIFKIKNNIQRNIYIQTIIIKNNQ